MFFKVLGDMLCECKRFVFMSYLVLVMGYEVLVDCSDDI